MTRRRGPPPALWLGAWMAFAPVLAAHESFQDCPDCPSMVAIDGGAFTMGSPPTEQERRKFEGPRVDVRVAGFAIGETEITRREYAAFVAQTRRAAGSGCFTYGFISFSDAEAIDASASWRKPGFTQDDDHPVTCISWKDAKDYVAWLSQKTGKAYRLPSEAEWEYAARAGTTSTFFWGEDENRGCDYANGGDPTLLVALPQLHEEIAKSLRDGDAGARFVKCDDGSAFTTKVRRYRPNAFGLYDMIGNVWEVVEDCWQEPMPTSGQAYVRDGCEFHRGRGGSWDDFPEELRSARRSRLKPDARRNDVGLRVARTLSVEETKGKEP